LDRADLPDASTLSLRLLREDDFSIVEELFGANGACGGCWCMWPRVPRGGKLWEELKGAKNRDNFRELVEAGNAHGVLAFCGEVPVGWCSFGPRSSFPSLETVRAIEREWSEQTWSIVCFFVPARWRGRGVARRLLEMATAQAFALGAGEVEGYPVVPKLAPSPVPAAFAWTGVPALFESAGYTELPEQEEGRRIFIKRSLPADGATS
jgi:GNAT superfamily N-acetyltransferase